MQYKINSRIVVATVKNRKGKYEFAIKQRVNRHGIKSRVLHSERTYSRSRDAKRGAIRMLNAQ